MSEVSDIFEKQIAARAPSATDMDAMFAFNISGEGGGEWVVDLREGKGEVRTGTDDDADCSITIDANDFLGLVKGEIPGPQLFMMGKLKIAGNMGLAMKLGQVLNG